MAMSFVALASAAALLIAVSTAITYIAVIVLDLPFVAVIAVMAVVGALTAVLRTMALSNFEEVQGASVQHPAYTVAGITPEESSFLFAAYAITASVQLFILRTRYTFRERAAIVAVTGISNVIFRKLL